MMRAIHERTADDRLALGRTINCSIVGMLAAIVLLEVPVVLSILSRPETSQLRLFVYSMPQVLTLAVSAGFVFGLFVGLGGRLVSLHLMVAVLAMAIVCSVASFAMIGWGVPVTERAFGALVAGHGNSTDDLSEHELTLNELSRRLESYVRAGRLSDARSLAVYFHSRWALSCATLVIALVALSTVSRLPVGRPILGVIAACAAYLGYGLLSFAGSEAGRHGTLPALAAAWLPNGVFLAVVLASLSMQRASNS